MSESAALMRWLEASAALQRRDWGAAAACLAPECVWTLAPTGVHFRGREAIRNFMQAGMTAGERAPPEIVAAFGTDTDGVFEYVSRGVATAGADGFAKSLSAGGVGPAVDPTPGQPYEFHVCFIFRLDQAGQISEVREYFAAPPAT